MKTTISILILFLVFTSGVASAQSLLDKEIVNIPTDDSPIVNKPMQHKDCQSPADVAVYPTVDPETGEIKGCTEWDM